MPTPRAPDAAATPEDAGMPRSATIIAQGLDVRSALGLHTAQLARALQSMGWPVALSLQEDRGVPPDLRPLLRDRAEDAGLTILQYPIWYPLAETFRAALSTAVFWYHGVTPPELWGTETDRDLLTRSIAGMELAWHGHLAACDSPFIADELRRYSGYPADRIRVVPLGIDVARFSQPPEPRALAQLRTQWKLGDQRVLLYTGRVAGNKRIDLLIDAIARLRASHPDLHLLIVGDTASLAAYRELAAALRSQAASAGLEGHVTFTGSVEDVQPYYHLADVYVSASLHEGFGVPLVEAMAAGVPVVAGASGAIPWALGEGTAEGQAGLTVAPGDAPALADAVDRALTDANLRRDLIERGRARAAQFDLLAFDTAALRVVAEAQALAQQGPAPAAARPTNRLYAQADVALRDYAVRSQVPVLGPLIAWLRRTGTSHIKEAYVDRIVEQQVVFNRQLATEVARLEGEIARLQERIARFEAATGRPDDVRQGDEPREPRNRDA